MNSRIVRCPKCGKFRKTTSIKTVKCFSCGKSFDVIRHTVSESYYRKHMDKEVGFR